MPINHTIVILLIPGHHTHQTLPSPKLFSSRYLGHLGRSCWETFGVPPDDTSIPNHDSLGSGWCQERQTHCPERSLLSPVSPEPHESLCYGNPLNRWAGLWRVWVCGVDLSFKREGWCFPVFCEGASETGLLRNHGLKPKFMLKRSSPLQNFQLFLKIRGTTAVHCNPWGFWRRSFGGIFERASPKFVVPGQVIFAYWGKCVGRWSSCFYSQVFKDSEMELDESRKKV